MTTKGPGYKATSGLASLLSLLKLGGAVTVILIVAIHLHDVTFSTGGGVDADGGQCLMSPGLSESLCIYAYVVGGVGVIAALLVGVLMCLTARCCGGFGHIADLILGVLGAAWFAVAGAIFLINWRRANNAGVPEAQWRFAVWLTCFITAALFLVSALLSMGLTCAACFGAGRRKHDHDVHDVEGGKMGHDSTHRSGGGCCGGRKKKHYGTAESAMAAHHTHPDYAHTQKKGGCCGMGGRKHHDPYATRPITDAGGYRDGTYPDAAGAAPVGAAAAAPGYGAAPAVAPQQPRSVAFRDGGAAGGVPSTGNGAFVVPPTQRYEEQSVVQPDPAYRSRRIL